ncbi:hypothetical protein MSVAZ_0017 (plasmid) [Methanosarcina vacuolata Z-761]|uniref:Uncharacterized protein n=1 Tax=Methanosarcina vacuolata Z-761 TaxID=1434123 RepID=A0A0E3LGC6_9EURY|nr:hypothetical protein MSVAZ_0017 [Methanosarcina vacuolata Z-761]
MLSCCRFSLYMFHFHYSSVFFLLPFPLYMFHFQYYHAFLLSFFTLHVSLTTIMLSCYRFPLYVFHLLLCFIYYYHALCYCFPLYMFQSLLQIFLLPCPLSIRVFVFIGQE